MRDSPEVLRVPAIPVRRLRTGHDQLRHPAVDPPTCASRSAIVQRDMTRPRHRVRRAPQVTAAPAVDRRDVLGVLHHADESSTDRGAPARRCRPCSRACRPAMPRSRHRVRERAAPATRRRPGTSDRASGPTQTRGARPACDRNGCTSSLGSVVMIVNVRMRGASSPMFGSCQISHKPANARVRRRDAG